MSPSVRLAELPGAGDGALLVVEITRADALEVHLHGIPGGFAVFWLHQDLHRLDPMALTLVHDRLR